MFSVPVLKRNHPHEKQYNHIYPTLEQEAWIVWVSRRTKILGYSENLRPAPEVEDIYAETETEAA